jgi:hypothetical protein
MKVIEMIHLEGCFRIRKIFSSRSIIPNEVLFPIGHYRDNLPQNEDIFGSRIEPVPKNFDYITGVNKINQVLSYDTVIVQTERKMSSIEDSIMVTGLRMTGGAKFNPNPNVTTTSGMQQMQDTKGLSTNNKVKKSAKKHKIRAESNEPAYSE